MFRRFQTRVDLFVFTQLMMNLECFKDRYKQQTATQIKDIIQSKYQDSRF